MAATNESNWCLLLASFIYLRHAAARAFCYKRAKNNSPALGIYFITKTVNDSVLHSVILSIFGKSFFLGS